MGHSRFKDVMRALTIMLVLALPVLAEDPKAEQPAAATATTTADATATSVSNTTTTAPKVTQPVQADSPLVAAAKRANRLGKKKSNVITNATLKSSGANAHVTTTETQAIFQMPQPLEPPRDTPEMAAAKAQAAQRAKAAEQAEADRKVKETQAKKAQEDAAANEEGYDGTQDDASEFTGAQPPPPQF